MPDTYSLRASDIRWVLYAGRGPGRKPLARLIVNLDPEGMAQDIRCLSMEGAPLSYRSIQHITGISAAMRALLVSRLVHHVEAAADGNLSVRVQIDEEETQ